MKLDEIKKLIERNEFEVSSKVGTLIAEGLFTFADLSNTILTARDIAKRVSDEMTFPGEIRITVLREMRTIEYAH